MEIFISPDEGAVKRLLSDAGLPTADLTSGHLEHFFRTSQVKFMQGL